MSAGHKTQKSASATDPAKEPLLNSRSPITNKHYKEKPWLENLHAFVDYLASGFLECCGGKILPMQYLINF